MDLPLLEWLETHTFPVEARFKDNAFARKVGDDRCAIVNLFQNEPEDIGRCNSADQEILST